MLVRRTLQSGRESVQALAAELDVNRSTLYRWMFAGLGDGQYSELITGCLVRRIADADKALAEARDPLELARAREMASFARMDLERRRPNLYGQRSHVAIEQVGDLGERLRRASQREDAI
jgi:transposase-like protein